MTSKFQPYQWAVELFDVVLSVDPDATMQEFNSSEYYRPVETLEQMIAKFQGAGFTVHRTGFDITVITSREHSCYGIAMDLDSDEYDDIGDGLGAAWFFNGEIE